MKNLFKRLRDTPASNRDVDIWMGILPFIGIPLFTLLLGWLIDAA